jgi:hypothetical protein
MKQTNNASKLYEQRKERGGSSLSALRNLAWFIYYQTSHVDENPAKELTKVALVLLTATIAVIVYGLKTT